MRLFRFLFLAAIAVAIPVGTTEAADLVVIAHPKSGIDKLGRNDVINIFLGRFRQLPSGLTAIPVDLPADNGERNAFYRQLVNKELAEINAYWARLVFSGRTTPPRQANTVDEALDFVATTPGAIGYVDRGQVNGRVKVVFDLAR